MGVGGEGIERLSGTVPSRDVETVLRVVAVGVAAVMGHIAAGIVLEGGPIGSGVLVEVVGRVGHRAAALWDLPDKCRPAAAS